MPSLVDPVVAPGRLSQPDQPTLDGDGVTLRPWSESDVPMLVTAYADPGIQRWHVRTMTAPEAEAWVHDAAAAWREERAASWAIGVSGVGVGRMTLKLRPAYGEAEAAYWVLPADRGRGVASRALRVAVDWAFAAGLARVELVHSTHNIASCRVAARAGFAAEGTKRRAGLHLDGWHDMHLHGRVPLVPDGDPDDPN